MMYVYYTGFDYAKFTIGYLMDIPTGDVTYNIGTTISLKDSIGKVVPQKDVYARILKLVILKAEEYEKDVLSGLFIRVYLFGMQEKKRVTS